MRIHNTFKSSSLLLLLLLLLVSQSCSEEPTCKPSGKIRGSKPPPGQCNTIHNSECCAEGKLYTTFDCSPPVTGRTKATLTINSFEEGQDGGGPSECDGKFHSDDKPIVALSSGWFNHQKRCLRKIRITAANGLSVVAKVVDECDSSLGCDAEHDYQPPCPNNIVDGSKAVWEALGVSEDDAGEMTVFWTDV